MIPAKIEGVHPVSPDDRPTLIGRRTPLPLKIVIAIGLPIIIIGVYLAVFQTYQYDVAAIATFIGGGLLLFMYQNDRSYRIAWNSDRIFMRNWGFKNFWLQRPTWHSMRYDEIASMTGRYGNNAYAKSRFMPFEYLELHSHKDGAEDIWIYPLALGGDVLALLEKMHSERPDIFPESVLQMMERVRSS